MSCNCKIVTVKIKLQLLRKNVQLQEIVAIVRYEFSIKRNNDAIARIKVTIVGYDDMIHNFKK